MTPVPTGVLCVACGRNLMEVSSALAQAQARLFALRGQLNRKDESTTSNSGDRDEPLEAVEPPPPHQPNEKDELANAQARLVVLRDQQAGANVVRRSTGWFDALKTRLRGENTGEVKTPLTEENVNVSINFNVKSEIVVQPEVAMGLLRGEMAAVGRVWLLLRGMDVKGRGAVDVQVAREKLAKKDGALGVCGWRQLRNLLREGEGTFWERRDGVIWLRSAAKVAVALEVERVSLLPVIVPVADLCGTIGDVRAVLMATFHSGRTGKKARPIARETLRTISGVSERSQATYETKRRVKATPQFAVVNGEWENIAWAHGSAAFQIKDKNGRFGRPGGVITVRQLPNCYTGTYRTASKGRKKRLNRRLAGLLKLGTTGNGYTKMQAVFAADARKGVKNGATYFQDRANWWGELQS